MPKDRNEETNLNDDPFSKAIGVIDKAMSEMRFRDVVGTGEVTDVLLDVRQLVAELATFQSAELIPA